MKQTLSGSEVSTQIVAIWQNFKQLKWIIVAGSASLF